MFVMKLCGGAHCAISRGEPGSAMLDLMVDDLDATHEHLQTLGVDVGRIRRQFPHCVFSAFDSEDNTLLVHDSHVAGVV